MVTKTDRIIDSSELPRIGHRGDAQDLIEEMLNHLEETTACDCFEKLYPGLAALKDAIERFVI